MKSFKHPSQKYILTAADPMEPSMLIRAVKIRHGNLPQNCYLKPFMAFQKILWKQEKIIVRSFIAE